MESSFLRNGRQRVPQRILVLQDRMNALRTGKSVCLKERTWGISSVGRFLAFAVKRQARPLAVLSWCGDVFVHRDVLSSRLRLASDEWKRVPALLVRTGSGRCMKLEEIVSPRSR